MSHHNYHGLSNNKSIHRQNHHNNRDQIHQGKPQQRQDKSHSVLQVPSLSSLNNMDKVNMVPGFILKLWKMINDPQCDDLISWSENGQSFIILDPPRFSQELSKYFKHNNLSSFIRQLNMYGFRKVATIENSGLHPGTDDLHFYHLDFIRDKPERLEAIKRKLPQKLADSVDLRNVYKGISEIEDKQKDVSQTLQDIKRENEMLWAELHDLRQKHQQQQLYISRLMKLVFEAMEQNGIKTNMLQIKRNSPLMIEASTGSIAPEILTPTPTTALSPNEEMISATTTTKTAEQTNSDPEATTVTTSPSTIPVNDNVNLTHGGATIAATTMADDETHSLKKSRLASPIDNIDGGAYQQQELLQNSTFQLQSATDMSVPLDEANFDVATQFQMLQNDQLQSQIDSAEYQIDTLVPSISDFDQEDLDLFSE